MPPNPIAEAFVTIRPDLTSFRAELQAGVAIAVAQTQKSLTPIIIPVQVAPVNVGQAAAVQQQVGAASAAAATGATQVASASKKAQTGLNAMTAESNALKGSLIGISRVTPVTVFGLGVVGTAALLAATATAGAVQQFATLEEQLNVFQAVTDSTADQMDQVARAARDLGADVKLPATSAVDAAIGLTELAKAGLSVRDSLAASRGVLQLAAAANIDAGASATIVATQLNAFSLAGTQAARVANLLAGASIAAQGEITDFAAAFQQVSAVANQSGLSIEQTTGLLAELAKAGLQGSDAGTSLRTTLLRLVPTTKEARLFVDALGISLNDNKTIGEQLPEVIEQYRTQLELLNPAQRTLALNQIFGQDAIRAASIIFGDQGRQLEQLIEQTSKAGNAQRLAEARTKGLAGAFSGLKSNAETLGATLGSVVSVAITPYIKGLTDILSLTNQAAETTVTFFDKVGEEADKSGVPIKRWATTVAKAFAISRVAGPQGVVAVRGIVAVKEWQDGRNRAEEYGEELDKIRNKLREVALIAQKAVREIALTNAFRDALPPGAGVVPGPDESVSGAAKAAVAAAKLKRERDAQRAKIDALQAAEDEASGKVLPPRNLTINKINAQLRADLQKELTVDKAIEDYFQKRLDLAQRGSERYQNVLEALASAREDTRSVQKEIKDLADQQLADQQEVFDTALANQEERLRQAAEAAGALSPQEDALIVFLRAQVKNEKLTTQEQLGYQRELNTELKARKDALVAEGQAAFELVKATLDLAIKRAQILTPNDPADDEKAINARIAANKRQIAKINKVKNQTTEQKLAIVSLKSEILDLRTTLKDLKGADSFSLSDLYAEALSELEQFGGNIASRGGILSAEDARAAFSATILAGRTATTGGGFVMRPGNPGVRGTAGAPINDPVARTVQSIGERSLSAANTTNNLLTDILRAVSSPAGKPNRVAANDEAGKDTADKARKVTKVKRAGS